MLVRDTGAHTGLLRNHLLCSFAEPANWQDIVLSVLYDLAPQGDPPEGKMLDTCLRCLRHLLDNFPGTMDAQFREDLAGELARVLMLGKVHGAADVQKGHAVVALSTFLHRWGPDLQPGSLAKLAPLVERFVRSQLAKDKPTTLTIASLRCALLLLKLSRAKHVLGSIVSQLPCG